MRWISEVCSILLLAALFGVPPASAQDAEPNIDLHIQVSTLDEASEPFRVGEHLVLSYDRELPLRYVGAAFAHEDFAERHIFSRNQHDVYVLVYELPDGLDEVEYRLVADGTWSTDPENPASHRLNTDYEVSVVDVSDRPRPIPDGPRRTDDDRVEFVYEGASGQRVHVTGSFNNWDPYMYRMEEVEPGRYEISLRLREATHFYHFVVNGRRRADSRNQGNTYTRSGRTVSRFDG